jgi:hypothetical protein
MRRSHAPSANGHPAADARKTPRWHCATTQQRRILATSLLDALLREALHHS